MQICKPFCFSLHIESNPKNNNEIGDLMTNIASNFCFFFFAKLYA